MTDLIVASRFRTKFPESDEHARAAMRDYVKFVAEQGPFRNDPNTLKQFNIHELISGYDKQGDPVMYLNAGELDLSSLHDAEKQEWLFHHCLYVWEHMLGLAPVHTAVFDLGALSWGCTNLATLNMFSRLMHTYEKYYPGISKQVLLINAPGIMPFVWPAIQCLIHSSMRDRIHFLSSPSDLKNFIDEAQIRSI